MMQIKSGDKGDSSADANIKSMPEGAITSRSCDSGEVTIIYEWMVQVFPLTWNFSSHCFSVFAFCF